MTNSTIQPNPTISLPEAKDRINNWRNVQSSLQHQLQIVHPEVSNSPVLTIKAFTFELNDLLHLYERILMYNNHDYTPYWALTPPNPVPINAIRFYPGNFNSKACLVGVGVTEFYPNLNMGGNDIIVLPTVVGQTSIYSSEFTCPEDICATHSILQATTPLNLSQGFTISLEEAKNRIIAWQNNQQQIRNLVEGTNIPVLNIKAVTISLDVLNDFLNRILEYNGLPLPPLPVPINPNPINAIRIYFGKTVVTDGSPIAPYACLICVGVTGFMPNSGSESNNGGTDITELPQAVANDGRTGIYDFSYPCPTTCPGVNQGILDK